MKSISNLIIGLLIGAILGLWLGINIGRDQTLFSNPFEERSVQEKFRKAGEGFLESAGDIMEHSSDTLRDKLKK